MSTFGPAYVRALDRVRILTQMETIRDVLLSACETRTWLTLQEIEKMTHYPQASISAQLRHLKKKAFGSYVLEKRRRGKLKSGLWEYSLRRPPQSFERTLFG